MGMPQEHQAPPGGDPGSAEAVPQASSPPAAAPRADPVAWLIALATFAAYAVISVSRYLRLDPGSWDLGIFTEYVKQIAHFHAPVVAIRGAGFDLLGDHFQPIVGLLAPVFRVFPSPVTLLVAQALLTGISVVPVCRAAQVKLGTGASRLIGAAYGFSWGLQQMINFDFHEIAFAVPLLAFSLSALVRRRLRATVAWALPLVFVKEDQGFTLAALGLVMVGMGVAAYLRARQAGAAAERAQTDWAWAGLLLIVWGVGWSMAAIGWIIPHFNPTHAYPYWYDGGAASPVGHFTLPGILHQLGASGGEKLHTTIMILLPVAFLALRSPLLLVAVPSLALRFLSTNSYFWNTDWHYSATVMPIVFLAAVDGMARIAARSAERAARRAGAGPPAWRRPGPVIARYGGVVMLGIAAWLAFQFPLSGLWRGTTYQISPHVQAEEMALRHVPSGTTVEATLSLLASLASRDNTFWVGSTGDTGPRYVVFDQTNSGYSPAPTDVVSFIDQQHTGYSYRQVFADDGVYVLRLTPLTGG
ncbi:MAG TPA: DUF2079 domain-containing protein [Streptosporangiaceae bacterium]|jgi:uncharacterized membrane protein